MTESRAIKRIVLLCVAIAMHSSIVLSQSVRLSRHYDFDIGAGGFLSIVKSDEGFLAQGTNFKSGVRQSHTVKVGQDGQLLTEHPSRAKLS